MKKKKKKLSQTPLAKKMRAMRKNETPKEKEKRLARRRELMRAYRERERAFFKRTGEILC